MQIALPAAATFSNLPPLVNVLCTSWHEAHSSLPPNSIVAAIVPVLVVVPEPIVTVAVYGSFNEASAVASAES